MGVDATNVSDRIEQIIGGGHSSETATLGISPRTKRVLEAAGHEARRLGHRCAIAAPEHVLLALSAQRDSVAAQILRDLDVSDDDLRHTLSELLAAKRPNSPTQFANPRAAGCAAAARPDQTAATQPRPTRETSPLSPTRERNAHVSDMSSTLRPSTRATTTGSRLR